VPGDAQPQRGGEPTTWRRRYLFDMSERLSGLLATGDDDAFRVKQPEAGQRRALRLR
jgi:hypothetical protein